MIEIIVGFLLAHVAAISWYSRFPLVQTHHTPQITNAPLVTAFLHTTPHNPTNTHTHTHTHELPPYTNDNYDGRRRRSDCECGCADCESARCARRFAARRAARGRHARACQVRFFLRLLFGLLVIRVFGLLGERLTFAAQPPRGPLCARRGRVGTARRLPAGNVRSRAALRQRSLLCHAALLAARPENVRSRVRFLVFKFLFSGDAVYWLARVWARFRVAKRSVWHTNCTDVDVLMYYANTYTLSASARFFFFATELNVITRNSLYKYLFWLFAKTKPAIATISIHRNIAIDLAGAQTGARTQRERGVLGARDARHSQSHSLSHRRRRRRSAEWVHGISTYIGQVRNFLFCFVLFFCFLFLFFFFFFCLFVCLFVNFQISFYLYLCFRLFS